MANPAVTYTFANSTTADATQVNTNFQNIIDSLTDGTKSLTIDALTCAGTATLNGAVTLGNGTPDDITWSGSLASTIPVKTTYSYDLAGSTIGLRSIYLGSADSAARTTRVIGGTVASSYTLTLPTSGGTSGYVTKTDGSGTLRFESSTILVTQTKTTTYTALVSDDVIFGSTNSAAWTLTLPTAVGITGKVFTLVYNGTGYANAWTIDPNSTETVGGSSTTTLNTPGETLKIVSDGSNWLILERRTETAWATGGSVNWTTNVSSSSGRWRRMGDSMEIQYFILLNGQPDNSTLLYTIPNSLTAYTTNVAGGTNYDQSGSTIGHGNIYDASTGVSYTVSVSLDSTTVFSFITNNGVATGLVSRTNPITFAASDVVTWNVRVPITGWNA